MEKTFIRTCIEKWRWFVVSVATTLVIAILFLLVYAPRYERTATILIKMRTEAADCCHRLLPTWACSQDWAWDC